MKFTYKIEFNLQKFVESRIITYLSQIDSNSKIPFDSMSLMTKHYFKKIYGVYKIFPMLNITM